MFACSTYSLGHTNTAILDGKSLVDLVGDDVDSQILAAVKLAWVCERLISDLVQGIGAVGDKLSQEDLLVRVDGVDNEAQKLGDLSLELESLGSHYCGLCMIVLEAQMLEMMPYLDRFTVKAKCL
jgi:hypothetical protein